MPVFSLDLGTLKDDQIKLFSERAVIGFKIELSVLGQNETIDRDVSRFNPLTVVLDFCPTVVRFDGMGMEVDDHADSFIRWRLASMPH